MDFQTAVRTVLRENYATFTGRARRSELWWFALFAFLVGAVLSLVDNALFGTAPDGQPVSILGAIWSLAILIPTLAVGVRRLHDTDRSGWWLLIAFVPLVGGLILIYFYVLKGDDGMNRFGPDPLR